MDDALSQSDFINARERFAPPKIVQPKLDPIITQIVGKPVYASDPRVLKLIVEFKKRKKSEDEPDNFLQNPYFIKELKQVFSQPL